MPTVSLGWPSNRAILLVHGVGNAKEGSYDALVKALKGALGDLADEVAIYELHYDVYNDWVKEKTGLAAKLNQAKAAFKIGISDEKLAETVAEYVGDVLWPVLSLSARAAVREAYLLQLKRMVRDGIAAGVAAPDQKLSVLAHSLGCFHTFEALHTAANKPSHALQPYTHGVRFDNVILMAPPIKLIRSVGNLLGSVVPNKGLLSTFDGAGLRLPGQQRGNKRTPSARRWISIAGKLDPVGGWFFRERADWAYTAIDGQESIVDDQSALDNVKSKEDLIALLSNSLSTKAPPAIKPNNPHSWLGYVTRHEEDLGTWLNA